MTMTSLRSGTLPKLAKKKEGLLWDLVELQIIRDDRELKAKDHS